ncbi:MAG: putative quinol monooxygenase [Dehalococcoidia bacterium]
MNTIVARLTIQEGKEDEALEALKKMAAGVEDKEPATLAYVVHRSIDNPSEIIFFELYTDDDASKAHREGESMRAFGAAFGQLFDVSQVKIERLERVAGVVRGSAAT